jgi:hypothetical protein
VQVSEKVKKPKKNVDNKPKVSKRSEPKDVTVFAEESLVEVDETRQPASLVFIGHVDAGKSTISG